eukprot:12144599-Alexandrium_andersonii.AAC.1
MQWTPEYSNNEERGKGRPTTQVSDRVIQGSTYGVSHASPVRGVGASGDGSGPLRRAGTPVPSGDRGPRGSGGVVT